MSASRCDKCGETVDDIDAGFSPALHAMKHDCGGTWRVAQPDEVVLARVHDAANGLEPIRYAGRDVELETLRSLLRTEADPAVRARIERRLAHVEAHTEADLRATIEGDEVES